MHILCLFWAPQTAKKKHLGDAVARCLIFFTCFVQTLPLAGNISTELLLQTTAACAAVLGSAPTRDARQECRADNKITTLQWKTNVCRGTDFKSRNAPSFPSLLFTFTHTQENDLHIVPRSSLLPVRAWAECGGILGGVCFQMYELVIRREEAPAGRQETANWHTASWLMCVMYMRQAGHGTVTVNLPLWLSDCDSYL